MDLCEDRDWEVLWAEDGLGGHVESGAEAALGCRSQQVPLEGQANKKEAWKRLLGQVNSRCRLWGGREWTHFPRTE